MVKVAEGLKTPATFIKPASVILLVVRALLSVRLLNDAAGTVCAAVPLKLIVLPVIVINPTPGV